MEKEKLQLTEKDLGEFSLEEIKCRQCSCFCSERQPVFLGDKPFAICTRNPKGLEVVKRWKAHAH